MTRIASLLPLLAAAALAGCAAPPPPAAAEAAPQPIACPAALPAQTRCLGGRDSAGAHYVIALPAAWNRHLVLHAHGGPLLGEPRPERALEDLQRWAVVVRAGFAWAGSTFAQGGVQVRAAAADTERLRRIFVEHVARPQRTVLHGQSWGAGVAAIAAESYVDGRPYDALLLTSGVLGGGTRSYDVRLDLRVIYQHLCANHPRADEPAYPLWRGLAPGATLTTAELAARARECLGVGLPAAQRSAEQSRRLRTLLGVIRIPERSLLGHLNWATFHFADIAGRYGASVFGNHGVSYRGSDDDAALNAAVLRYRADPDAWRRFAADTDPQGRIGVPVLTVHGIDDAVAFVELEEEFRRTMQAGGSGERLVQTYTADAEHSYLSDPVYPALLHALLAWVERGEKPTPASVAARCDALRASFGDGCRFVVDYRPAPLAQRVPARERP